MKRALAALALLLLSVFLQAQTPNIGLNVPTRGTTNWDTLVNQNFSALDSLLSGNTALPLSFWSANAAHFQLTPPVSTKGDLFGYSTAPARLPVGSDGECLVADSTQTLGLKYAPCASTSTIGGCVDAATLGFVGDGSNECANFAAQIAACGAGTGLAACSSIWQDIPMRC